MMSQPELDMTSRKALLRSLNTLSLFLKVVMAMSSVLGGVPDWIWKPLAKLFPKIAALEDGLFNAADHSRALAHLRQQRADWDALMQAQTASAEAPAPKNWSALLIGCTLTDFFEDHAIDFATTQTNAIDNAAQLATDEPNPNLLPDPADDPGLDPGRHPDLVHSALVCGSETPFLADVAPGRSGSRRAPGRVENVALGHVAEPQAEGLCPSLLIDHSDVSRNPGSILRIHLQIARAHTWRKPTPRARPPPANPKAKSPAAPARAGAAARADANGTPSHPAALRLTRMAL